MSARLKIQGVAADVDKRWYRVDCTYCKSGINLHCGSALEALDWKWPATEFLLGFLRGFCGHQETYRRVTCSSTGERLTPKQVLEIYPGGK